MFDDRIIANIKSLGIDMINESGSGHPGIVLGAAPIIYTLFSRHLRVVPDDFSYINRDRFIMSAGHGSALLYATMFMAGYPLKIDDLKNFRKLGSLTPGHPEYDINIGIESTTGPLGQGVANAIGLAIGQKYLYGINEHYDYNIYALCSDGDLMEGISSEASSLAGTLKLDNIILLYDSNDVCLDGKTSRVFNENVLKRYEAYGWSVFKADNSVASIDSAIIKAKADDRPSIIEIKTIIGEGSKYQGTNTVHGKKLETSDIDNIKKKLGINPEPFYVDADAKTTFIKMINNRHHYFYRSNTNKFKERLIDYKRINYSKEGEMRVINSEIMSQISLQLPNFISGSADLFESTKSYIKDGKDLSNTTHGKNIFYGVREHAMGAISNGLALSNLYPVASTFLAFADYLKPALRLSAIMDLPVTYLFTHDSITIGSDGPTHQPIEQLAMLRSTPNMTVYRPSDGNELFGSWQSIIERAKPASLIVSKNFVKNISTSSIDAVKRGGYIIRKEKNKLDGIIIATGYEVHLAFNIAERLYKDEQIDLRVVSMPSVNLFLEQDSGYQELIISKKVKTMVIEAASSFGWHRFVKDNDSLVTIETFGASGSTDELISKFGFDEESVYLKTKKLFS